MARLTSNLKLRVADNLTSDAVYNLDRIDLLGGVFPLGSSNDLVIQADGSITLNPGSNSIALSGNTSIDGSLSLSAAQFNTTITTATQTANLTLTLPGDAGTSGQFLQTDGAGITTWADPPTANFSSLNDTNFTALTAGQVAQYNGTEWINVSLSATNDSGTFDWTPANGATRTIIHNFNSTNIVVWVYDTAQMCQVFIDTIDYLDNNTILLTSDEVPANPYRVHLIQTS